jgi:hypothetical protein
MPQGGIHFLQLRGCPQQIDKGGEDICLLKRRIVYLISTRIPFCEGENQRTLCASI